jgi:hypothetical protein
MSSTGMIWSQRKASEQRHICIVTETYPPEINGVAMTLAHLVEGLRTQGYAVSVVHPRRQPSESSSDSRLDCSKVAGRNTAQMWCMWRQRGRLAGRRCALPGA